MAQRRTRWATRHRRSYEYADPSPYPIRAGNPVRHASTGEASRRPTLMGRRAHRDHRGGQEESDRLFRVLRRDSTPVPEFYAGIIEELGKYPRTNNVVEIPVRGEDYFELLIAF